MSFTSYFFLIIRIASFILGSNLIVGNITKIMFIKNFFIVVLLFFSVGISAKNIFLVKNIQFEGLKYISQDEALKSISFTIGKEVSEYAIQNSIRSLFKTGKFEDIKVIYSGQSIIFKIKEQPIISDVVYSGNHMIKNVIMNQYLNKLGILKNTLFNPCITTVFIKNIENFYHDSGKYNANIKILKSFSKNNTISLKIIIHEGISAIAKTIKILGNRAFSENKIVSLFKLNCNKNWWNILDKCIYSDTDLNNDLNNMRNFYLNRGYLHFNIDKKEVKFSKNKNNVYITINVHEGNQYRVANFSVNGQFPGYKKIILDTIHINHNELYNQEKINLIVNRIKQLLSENGYVKAQVAVNSEVDYEKKSVFLNFYIDIKERFFVKNIIFRGNELTQDSVLRRELKQIEGNYLNIKQIELGKKRLEKTQYFSDVRVIQDSIAAKSNQVNIIYEVKEKPTGSINFGLGYGIDSGISFNADFSQDNLFGYGNYFKVSAIKNDNQKYVDLSFSHPYFIFNRNNLNAKLFYRDSKYNLNHIANSVKNTYGMESELGFSINDNNTVNFGFGYTHNGIINIKKQNRISHVNKKTPNLEVVKNNLVNDITLNYSWMFNNLKYLYFPIEGSQIYMSGKNTIPGSDNNFYKIILDSEQYFPLNKKKDFIFFSHFHMGFGSGFNKKKLPFYENFYAGSSNNIRGFRLSTIGPKSIYDTSDIDECIGYKNNTVCKSINSIGGNATAIVNLEFITPIPLLNKQYSNFLRSSFFLDAGNIWNTELNNIKNKSSLVSSKYNSFDDIYASTGISLQWFSPIGPLVFSYSYPIYKHDNYQLEAFQFHFGKNW